MKPTPPASEPVRLKVAYKTAQGVVSEFTRSVGKGGVAIESAKSLPLGTRFVFELIQAGSDEKVEVLGEVVQVTPLPEKAKYLLNIRYDPAYDRTGLDSLLNRIFEAHEHEKVRKHVRVPIHLPATEDIPYSPSYLIRDVSKGGLGVEVEAPKLPAKIKAGTPFLLEISTSRGTLALHGEVAWVFEAPKKENAGLMNPQLGIAFGKLRPETEERLDRILTLRGLPPPPWKARVSFGLEAVGRMP